MKGFINNNQIKYETEKAVLIKLVHSKKQVWIPQKLVYQKSWYSVVYLPDSFIFNLSGQKISGASLKDLISNRGLQSQVKENVPIKREAKKIEADESLKR